MFASFPFPVQRHALFSVAMLTMTLQLDLHSELLPLDFAMYLIQRLQAMAHNRKLVGGTCGIKANK